MDVYDDEETEMKFDKEKRRRRIIYICSWKERKRREGKLRKRIAWNVINMIWRQNDPMSSHPSEAMQPERQWRVSVSDVSRYVAQCVERQRDWVVVLVRGVVRGLVRVVRWSQGQEDRCATMRGAMRAIRGPPIYAWLAVLRWKTHASIDAHLRHNPPTTWRQQFNFFHWFHLHEEGWI